jgi:hypothetical protein
MADELPKRRPHLQERRPSYDELVRERVRRELVHYKEQHGIGVPALQQRIADAIGDVPDRIPLKSLQRFLAGTHRTEDTLVHLCIVFLSRVIPFAQEMDMATSLAQFFRYAPDFAESYWELTGTYHAYVRAGAGDAEFEVPYSVMNVEPARLPNYLGASELVINLERAEKPARDFESVEGNLRYEPALYKGLLTPYRDSVFILFLRRYPHMRIHLLRQRSTQDGEIILEGTGLEPPVMPDEPPPEIWHPNFDIRYVRISDKYETRMP